MDYASNTEEEVSLGDRHDIYPQLVHSAREPWHELQEKSDDNWLFIIVGASDGCIPASFFAHRYYGKTLSLLLLSCVPVG